MILFDTILYISPLCCLSRTPFATYDFHRVGSIEHYILSAQDTANTVLLVGFVPLMIVATAGTVDVGAIDDLAAIAAVSKREGIWMHIDGAYGALGVLSDTIRPLLSGIELADSIAFDFHKWGQVMVCYVN